MAAKDTKPTQKGPSGKGGDKKKKAPRIGALYEKGQDKLTKKNMECPKCGSGVFMGNHKDRWACGKCRYTEFKK